MTETSGTGPHRRSQLWHALLLGLIAVEVTAFALHHRSTAEVEALATQKRTDHENQN